MRYKGSGIRQIKAKPFSIGTASGFISEIYLFERLRPCLSDPDELFRREDSVAIKDLGKTKTAIIVLDLGKGEENFFLKKFRCRGLWQRLFGSLGQSRASKAWSMSYKLLAHDIPIPKPVAIIEERRKGLLMNSYFISSFVSDAVNLKEYANTSGTEFMDEGEVMKNLGRAIGKMHFSNLLHGDLKWSNMLLTGIAGGQNPIFVDLDHARSCKKICNADRAKDLARFMVDVLEMELHPRLIDVFLAAYFDAAKIEDQVRDRFLEQMNRTSGRIISRHQRKSF